MTPPAIKKVKAQNKEWLGGSQQTVRWASEGDVAKVTILLTRPGARFLDMNLAFEVDNTGQHVVTVPRGLAPARDYRIDVHSASDMYLSAVSACISIDADATPPAIKKVKAQNKAWLGGSQQTVRWASEGDVAKVTILLTRPGARFLDMNLAFEVDNTGQHVVTVPRGLAPARDYRIDVHSASDMYLSGQTSRFTIDDEHRARCVQIATALLGLPPHLRLPYPILRSICMQAATV